MTGKIIYANYNDIITHMDKVGMFLIIYDEKYDKNTQSDKNVLALKITSQVDSQHSYAIPIKSNEITRESLVLCNKFYTFDKHDVIKEIGIVNDNYLKRVINEVCKLMRAMNSQRENRQKSFDFWRNND